MFRLFFFQCYFITEYENNDIIVVYLIHSPECKPDKNHAVGRRRIKVKHCEKIALETQ